MNKWIVIAILGVFVLGGCNAIRQFHEDTKLSDSTPYAPGEKTVGERADRYAQPLAGLPWGAGTVAVPVGAFVIAYFLKGLRGRRIRKQQVGTSTVPATGFIGKTTGLEAVVQFLADVSTAVFEVGKDGSAMKRGWKGFLYAVLGSGALAPAIYPHIVNSIQAFLATPPPWLNGAALTIAVGLGTAVVAFLEKKLATVKPLEPAPPTPAPVNG